MIDDRLSRKPEAKIKSPIHPDRCRLSAEQQMDFTDTVYLANDFHSWDGDANDSYKLQVRGKCYIRSGPVSGSV